jgi:D-alanyl-lipoteichoic acid acyltransferase DltB (MBOAT superfamily)
MINLTVVDPQILIGLAAAIIFCIAVSVLPVLRKSSYLWLVCLIECAIFYRRYFLGFVVVNAIAYAAARWLSGKTDRSLRWRCACVAIFLLIIIFTLGRVQHWERLLAWHGSPPFALFSLDMWLVLRLATLFWEVGSAAVTAPSIVAYITWTCLPFTLGGPLIRYSQFPGALAVNRSLWSSPGWWQDMAIGAAKLIAGIGLYAAQSTVVARWPNAHWVGAGMAALITGPLGFYLTYAGYFHLMQTLARPAGFKVPESFNFPIGRENISAFWMNWNMTATYVFRDYIFYNRWGRRTFNIYFNTMVLFTLVGLWHAANAYWILWGFLHGLLFCSFLLWRKYGTRLAFLPLRGTFAAQAAARGFTYLCVCSCWYLPSKILQRLG